MPATTGMKFATRLGLNKDRLAPTGLGTYRRPFCHLVQARRRATQKIASFQLRLKRTLRSGESRNQKVVSIFDRVIFFLKDSEPTFDAVTTYGMITIEHVFIPVCECASHQGIFLNFTKIISACENCASKLLRIMYSDSKEMPRIPTCTRRDAFCNCQPTSLLGKLRYILI